MPPCARLGTNSALKKRTSQPLADARGSEITANQEIHVRAATVRERGVRYFNGLLTFPTASAHS
jgi:hypothetical protein